MKLKRLVAVALALCLNFAASAGYACEQDTIETNAGDGVILVMISGAVYQVDDIDQVTSSIWLEASDVYICPSTYSAYGGTATIINIDDKDKVTARRVR